MMTRHSFTRFISFFGAACMMAACSQIHAFSPGSSSILRRRNTVPHLFIRSSTNLRALSEEDPVITRKKIDEDEDDDDADELVDSLTEKLQEMEGLWYSDDFYGPHGREWVKISSTLLGERATSALVAVKVTGDPNVPAGCETFKTAAWPGMGQKVPAQIQIRSDPKDPNGFGWIPGELTLVDKDQIRLLCQYNMFMRSQGTFYKQRDEEGDGGSDEK